MTVTATLADGAAWAEDIEPWEKTSATMATYTHTFATVECTSVSPVAPTVVAASCTGGVVVPPAVTPGETEGILYALVPDNIGDGTADSVVEVTATVLYSYAWVDPLPNGWEPVVDSNVIFGFKVTLKAATCRSVTPATPAVGQAVCVNGALSPPTLQLPANTADVSYGVNPGVPYVPRQTVTITATLAPTGVAWGPDRPAGWTFADQTATLRLSFKGVACIPVSHVDPRVAQATCTAGEVVPPKITLPTTAGVTYTMEPTVLGNAPLTVTVTAKLDAPYTWGQLGRWTETGPTTATLTVQLVAASCTAITPVGPELTQAVCTNGELSAPTLELAMTDKITYTANPEGPYEPGETVTVTATLDDTGVGWGPARPVGWTFVDAQVATLEIRFDDVVCTPVIPTAPGVAQATCTAGAVVPPTVTFPATAGVTYTTEPAEFGDGTAPLTVTVTARLADGFEWGELGDEWTATGPTATFSLQLEGASCAAVTPAAPTLTQAVCTNGALSAPTLQLATTAGVSYRVDPGEPYEAGQTVAVTATLAEAGVGWGDARPAGWAFGDQTATYTVTFDDVACTPVTLEDPIVLPLVESTGASVQLPATPGMVYAVDSASSETSPVVSATLHDGFSWGQLPNGWRQDDATTATFLPARSTPTPTPDPLAHTGMATVVLQSVVATSALLAGFSRWLLGRRRAVR